MADTKGRMLREERLGRISQSLMTDRKVLCDQLAKEFNLTVASVRLDLAELEKRGIARRVYGGAILSESEEAPSASSSLRLSESRFAERFGIMRPEKEAIGRTASELIHDDETVMIDGGTTTYHVCSNLAEKQNISIISCAYFDLWQDLSSKSNLQIFLTGGYLRSESLSLVGEVAENMLHSFRASKAVMGIDGISLENGLTTLNFMEAAVKKRIIEASQEIIIVADHTKFAKVCPIPVAPIGRASKIVTDPAIPADMRSKIEQLGVQVIIADLA